MRVHQRYSIRYFGRACHDPHQCYVNSMSCIILSVALLAAGPGFVGYQSILRLAGFYRTGTGVWRVEYKAAFKFIFIFGLLSLSIIILIIISHVELHNNIVFQGRGGLSGRFFKSNLFIVFGNHFSPRFMLPCHCEPKIYFRFFEVCT